MKELINYIKDHDQEAKEVDGKLMVLDQWIETKGEHEGMLNQEWVEIPADVESVREWLGY